MLTGCQLLRALRERRHETLEHIATDADIAYRSLSNIERGLPQKPTRETLHAILAALDRGAPYTPLTDTTRPTPYPPRRRSPKRAGNGAPSMATTTSPRISLM